MPFVKLDCGMLNSSLWIDQPAREVFITALLMAIPFELQKPEIQYQVRSLKPTGWKVPPGWYGLVPAAGVGIIGRALIADSQVGMKALERLCGPDPDSRSQEFEGRRMARINGGYILLNYDKYRERDYSAAERQRRYRERKKLGVTRNVNSVTRNITQAEGEAQVEEEIRINTGFQDVRKNYPKREGSQRWQDAESSYNARLKEGHTDNEILSGVIRYADFCNLKKITGSAMVQQAATFLGRNKGFMETWEIGNEAPGKLSAPERVERATALRRQEREQKLIE